MLGVFGTVRGEWPQLAFNRAPPRRCSICRRSARSRIRGLYLCAQAPAVVVGVAVRLHQSDHRGALGSCCWGTTQPADCGRGGAGAAWRQRGSLEDGADRRVTRTKGRHAGIAARPSANVIVLQRPPSRRRGRCRAGVPSAPGRRTVASISHVAGMDRPAVPTARFHEVDQFLAILGLRQNHDGADLCDRLGQDRRRRTGGSSETVPGTVRSGDVLTRRSACRLDSVRLSPAETGSGAAGCVRSRVVERQGQFHGH